MRQKLNKNLGYVTQITEKIMLAVIAIMTLVAAGIDVWGRYGQQEIYNLQTYFYCSSIQRLLGK